MTKLAIPHDAMVLIGDGRKALFLRNAGDEKFPDLRAERVFAEENPPTHEQGADRPAAEYPFAGWSRRVGIEQTDWHRLEEDRFIARVAAAMEDVMRTRGISALVVVAPPRMLADLRRAFHPDVQKRIVAEVGKDLTKHPVAEITNILVG